MTPDIALAIWSRAKEQEFGVAIEVRHEDKVSVNQLLTSVRKKAGDRDLMNLMIVQPGSFPNQLWLVKKTVEL